MGCCEGCGQIVLVIINILFSLIGILLLVIGCLVRFGSDLLDTYLKDAYDAFTKVLQEAAASKDIDISNLDIGDLLGDASLAFIVIGVFFFILGIVGCLGACCKVRFLLVVYTIILITIFAAEVVFVILLFTIKPTIDGWIRTPLIDELKKEYTGSNGTDAFTLALNFIMHEMNCCGIDSYKEFANASKWSRYNGADKFEVPLICCKNVNDTLCAVNPKLNNSYIGQDCYGAVNDWLTDNSSIMIGAGSGIAVVQLILIIFSFVICCKSRKDKDDKSNYSDDNIPIQPYRESQEASGHRNMYYESSPQTYRDEVRGKGQYEGNRQRPSAPYEQGYDQHEPYRGRTDYYSGPPEGYRSGPPPEGYRSRPPPEGYRSRDQGYQAYR